MKNNTTFIDAGNQDRSRPSERPPKSNWRIEMVKKLLSMLQYITVTKTAEVVWHYFSQPGKVRFTEAQQALLDKAIISETYYQGFKIFHYQWGTEGPKVLLAHGWRSKTADFRRMIEALLTAGYVVEGVDMKAHGRSEGVHTALPEFKEIIKEHYIKNGPYEAMIGYSLGGLATGLVASELAAEFQPQKLVLIASPSHAKYFFEDIIKELGFKHEVFVAFCNLVEKTYKQPVDYFDIRDKTASLSPIQSLFVYDETDETVPFDKGLELHKIYPDAHFLHSKGLGHYKVIASEPIIDHIIQFLETPKIDS
jgi:hypothetical protein